MPTFSPLALKGLQLRKYHHSNRTIEKNFACNHDVKSLLWAGCKKENYERYFKIGKALAQDRHVQNGRVGIRWKYLTHFFPPEASVSSCRKCLSVNMEGGGGGGEAVINPLVLSYFFYNSLGERKNLRQRLKMDRDLELCWFNCLKSW